MCYIRSSFKEAWLARTENVGINPSFVMLTEPRYVKFEAMCLFKLMQLLEELKRRTEEQTSLEQDLDLLNISEPSIRLTER